MAEILLFPGIGLPTAERLARCRTLRGYAGFAAQAEACLERLDWFIRPDPELESMVADFVASCAVGCALLDSGVQPVAMAGYSSGMYAALVTSGVLSFADGFAALSTAYHLVDLHYRCRGRSTVMGAIIGYTREEVERELIAPGLAAHPEADLGIACVNSDLHHVLAGDAIVVEDCLQRSLAGGALRAVRLGGSLGYHRPQLAPCGQALIAALAGCRLTPGRVPLVSCLDGSVISPAAILHELGRNLHTQVRLDLTATTLADRFPDAVVFEPGAGTTLSRILPLLEPRLQPRDWSRLLIAEAPC